MLNYDFDARTVEPDAGGGGWPAGWHKVIITSPEMKPTKDGQGQRLVFTIAGVEGPMAGKQWSLGFNVANANPQAVEIARKQLSSVLHVIGVPTINPPQALCNIPFLIQFKADKEGNTDWKGGVLTIDGRDPSEVRAGKPASKAPPALYGAGGPAATMPAAAPIYAPQPAPAPAPAVQPQYQPQAPTPAPSPFGAAPAPAQPAAAPFPAASPFPGGAQPAYAPAAPAAAPAPAAWQQAPAPAAPAGSPPWGSR